MDTALTELRQELDDLKKALKTHIPQVTSLNMLWGNPNFPGCDREDMEGQVDDCLEVVKILDGRDLNENQKEWLGTYKERIYYFRTNALPSISSSAHVIYPAFESTIKSAKDWLSGLADGGEHPSASIRKVARRVRSLESQLNAIEPRSEHLSAMVARIEGAHDAAEQLPTELEDLAEGRKKVDDVKRSVDEALSKIMANGLLADGALDKMRLSQEEAQRLTANLNAAYTAAMSQGLASAFDAKARSLNTSIRYWVAGLTAALIGAAVAGYFRINALLHAITTPDASSIVIILNLLLSLFSIGAPVWFAWLATRNISQRFRLSEDYAFKAAVASSYEGFRNEANRINPEMEEQLLRSALSRLDEQPLRLVDNSTPSSPFQELLNSEAVKEALKIIPGFSKDVVSLARDEIGRLRVPRVRSRLESPIEPIEVPRKAE